MGKSVQVRKREGGKEKNRKKLLKSGKRQKVDDKK